jgi:hypothetical protein
VSFGFSLALASSAVRLTAGSSAWNAEQQIADPGSQDAIIGEG